MFYQEYPPPKELAPYIRLFWIQVGRAEEATMPPLRIVADGIVELVFHFAQPFNNTMWHGALEQQPLCFAIAQLNRPLIIQPNGEIGIVAVRFQAWGAHHFLSHPTGEFADLCVDLTELWGPSVRDLQEQVQTARSHRERLVLVSHYLLARLKQRAFNHQATDVLIHALSQSKTEESLKDIGQRLGFSQRSMERWVRNAVGVSPKHLRRIQRFLRTCKRLRQAGFSNLTEVGHAEGFYDQSHFISEFSYFSGLTPSNFLKDPATVFLDF